MTQAELKIFTDGGSRGNPGPAATGVVILTTKDELLTAFGRYLGETTNNVAEYTAIIQALEEAQKYQPKRIDFYMDSELAVRQLIGRYKVKTPHIKELFDRVISLCEGKTVYFNHVPRELNKAADAQVNEAIDRALWLKKS